jgi:hypothetical protein
MHVSYELSCGVCDVCDACVSFLGGDGVVSSFFSPGDALFVVFSFSFVHPV